MKSCPHCGAKLAEDARFCPHCMTALNTKRVIPTPKYLPVRWLSAAAAVLVLCAMLWGVWRTAQSPRPPIDGAVGTTASPSVYGSTGHTTLSTTLTAAPTPLVTLSTTGTSVTTSVTESRTQEPSASASRSGFVTGYIPAVPTSSTIPTAPKNTATGRPTSISTTASSVTTTSTTQKPTTTTTTAAPKPAYPPEWDTVYRSTTEDNLPIEEVNWTYKAVGASLYLSRYSMAAGPTGSFSRTYTQTLLTHIPMSQCIILTGFDAPTSNGIYRIPAAIDGKVVVGVNMGGNVAGACHFNDPDIAPTVKRIYLPPEMLMIGKNTINQCTALEGIYFGTDTIWIEPEALPATDLYMYSYTLCCASCYAYDYDLPLLKNYCHNIDQGNGATVGLYKYYWRATWRLSFFAQDELYHSYGALSPYD